MSLQSSSSNPAQVADRSLVFVGGKGGVGKTVVSQALARAHAKRGRRTLWVTFEDPSRPPGELLAVSRHLWHLNCVGAAAFEEYAALKIGAPRLTRLFVHNKLMRYLSEAAPGIHELVLLGKVWYEREHYERVVVDMPSTGYGLAMFQSTDNFARLFRGGPIHKDAEAMLATFRDSKQCGHMIVALPEEMPLTESLELRDFLMKLFPANEPALLVNRKFPPLQAGENELSHVEPPYQWDNPLASSALDYVRKRNLLEAYNLKLWQDPGLRFGELDLVPPPPRLDAEETEAHVIEGLQAQIEQRGYA